MVWYEYLENIAERKTQSGIELLTGLQCTEEDKIITGWMADCGQTK